MKKMLVLILVIGITATADAAIIQLKVDGSMDGPGNDTIVNALSSIIYVNCDTDNWPYDMFLGILIGTEDKGYYGDVIPIPPHALADIWDPDPWFKQLTNITGFGVAGDQFQTTLFRTGDAVQIDLLDDGLNVIDSVTLVPEPATLLLLGLGGLAACLIKTFHNQPRFCCHNNKPPYCSFPNPSLKYPLSGSWRLYPP